mmetsp:Transcript_18587/g.52501  ORF Transcript_18587/g.52501 Transcript_18587/m.52501 type:complete len:204 (-) Transcript_18587:394-1005(-)
MVRHDHPLRPLRAAPPLRPHLPAVSDPDLHRRRLRHLGHHALDCHPPPAEHLQRHLPGDVQPPRGDSSSSAQGPWHARHIPLCITNFSLRARGRQPGARQPLPGGRAARGLRGLRADGRAGQAALPRALPDGADHAPLPADPAVPDLLRLRADGHGLPRLDRAARHDWPAHVALHHALRAPGLLLAVPRASVPGRHGIAALRG